MPRRSLLVLALLLLAADARALTGIAYDPYASVSWPSDIRCKTQLHDHIDTQQNRLKAYDDAGYCAVSFLHYSGVPFHSSGWKQLHWPPEEWFNPAFLASLRNIKVLIPDAEHIGWTHISSPFLTTYLECYQNSASRYPNPLCRQVGDPRHDYHYSTDAELVAKIHQHGGLASLTHQVLSPEKTLLDGLPTDLYEVCSAHTEYRDWQCDNTTSCSGWDDGPARMLVNYDRKLRGFPRTWAVCVNDWHGPFDNSNPAGPDWIDDSGYTIVLAPQIDLPTMKERMSTGAMLAIQDRSVPKGTYPQVERIDVTRTTIHLELSQYTSVTWIHNGAVVGTQPDVDVAGLIPGTIRAEIRDAQGSVVFTQPWHLQPWTPQCGDGADNDGDGFVDLADADCSGPLDDLEQRPSACANDLDDDGDALVDLADPDCSAPEDDREAPDLPFCSDGFDNDGDGWIDLDDPDCASPDDPSEATAPDCGNGLDDDGDGLVDLADADCSAPEDDSEGPDLPFCSDGIDNDGDGSIDLADPDCASPADPSEASAPVCSNGSDDDGDGLIDHPADPGCADATGATEAPQCNDGLDNDADGLFDLADPDCSAGYDPLEAPPPPACSNGVDDDLDGKVDFPADPGCFAGSSGTEAPACDNDVDDDSDGKIDWNGGGGPGGPDPECSTGSQNREAAQSSCGLGAELALVIPGLLAWRRRRAA